jgi:hypothetical protein
MTTLCFQYRLAERWGEVLNTLGPSNLLLLTPMGFQAGTHL